VTVGEMDALSDGILKPFIDKQLREKYSLFGKERTMHFSVDQIIKQYENIIVGTSYMP
jgi:hypothetical protein